MLCRGSLDSEQTLQVYRGFMELVEANERSRKNTGKPTSTVSSLSTTTTSSSLSSSSSNRTELPNFQAKSGSEATFGQRESLLSSRSTSANTSSAVVSPLTGNLLVSGNASEDVPSPRVGKYASSSYSNGLTTESCVRGTASSSSANSSSAVVSPLTGNLLVSGNASEDVSNSGVGKYSSSSYSNGLTTESRVRGTTPSSSLMSANSSSAVVSPLTGNLLVSGNASEDISNPRVGLTSESRVRGSSVSSSYSSRLTPRTTDSSPSSRLFDNANDSFASRVINGGEISGYGLRSPDVPMSSYLSRSRQDDANSPAARLQSLRDTYCSTMWNDSVTNSPGYGVRSPELPISSSYLARSRQDDADSPAARLQSLRDSYCSSMWSDSSPDRRHSSAGRSGVESLTSSLGLSGLSSYDADPTPELLSGTTAGSSRYERVMSARSRSTNRRGDAAREGVTATRSGNTSPVAAASFAVNDLSDVRLPSAVEHTPPARPTPVTVSSRAERMKSYGIGTTSRTDRYDRTASSTGPVASTIADKLGTQPSETTMLPPNEHDTTSATQTASETSWLKTSSSLVSGTETPRRTEISQTPVMDKSNTQRDAVVLPMENSPKTVTVNSGRKSPEISESRLPPTTSSVQIGYKNAEKGKLAASTNGVETTSSGMTSTSSGVTSSEADRPRKTDADDIAGSSLTAATLNRLQAAAAAAADAVVSAAACGTGGTTAETSSAMTSSSLSEQRTTTENTDGKDRPNSVDEAPSASPTRNPARARKPTTLEEMLTPSISQKNAKTSLGNRTNDSARSGSGQQPNGAPSSFSKAAKSVDSASKSASVKGDGAVKLRSKKLANVSEMLVPTPTTDSNSGVGRSSWEQTSSATPSTGRTRTSSTSSTTDKKSSGNVTAAKPSSQPSRRHATSSDTDRRTSTAITLQQTHTIPASKVIQAVQEKKMASKTPPATRKQTSATASKTSKTAGEDDWKTTLAGIIQASATTTDDGVSEQPIQPSPSISSLVSEPPSTSASRPRRKSTSGDGLSSLMRPTASSLARRGSIGDAKPSSGSAGPPSYAAPTSSSASKTTSSRMTRTTSTPALRGGLSLATPNRGTSSGRSTPTTPRRTADARVARSNSSASAITARSPRQTPGRTTTAQRGAAQTAGRLTPNDRSRHNSTSSGASSDI